MHPLAHQIASIGRRLIWRQRATAACWILATIIGAGLVLGLTDFFMNFADPGLRIMVTLALVGVAMWAAYRWWYSPGRWRSEPLAVARRVESQFPQLQDSLASALEFLGQSEEDATAGSPQLRRLVVAEAQNAVAGLPLDEVIDRRPLRKAASWLAAAMLILLICLALDAGSVRTAMLRLIAPLGSAQWPRQNHLAFREVPGRLAAGQPFEVELIDTAGQLPNDVVIQYRMARDGGHEMISEPMTRTGDLMVARRENVRQSFAFRAEGGDDQTMPWTYLEVVEPPQLESLKIIAHPPAYTGLAARAAERHFEVLAGTQIEMTGAAGEPLSAVRVLLDGQKPIDATITADAAGRERHAFHVAPQNWVATTTGPYRLELTDADGVAGAIGQWNMRVQPDTPPSVAWQRPTDDLYVTPGAQPPIKILAKDNLAIQRVELIYERSDRSQADRDREPKEKPIELHRGPTKPATADHVATGAGGESRAVEYLWDLALLELPVGAQLTIYVEATDYRPATGRTAGPRRITIITPEELEARLADRQGQIVRQLERALAVEQSNREQVRQVEIQQRDTGSLTIGNRNTLQAAELNQQRARHMLTDDTEGVPALVDAVLGEIEMNRLSNSEMQQTLQNLSVELGQLTAGPLATADRELTATRAAIDAIIPSGDSPADDFKLSFSASQVDSIAHSLSTLGAAQDEVVAALERLINELSSKVDYRRFVRLLMELRQSQIDHEKATRADIPREALPLRVDELTRAQLAILNIAAAGQSSIATRYEKIEQGLDKASHELADDDESVAGTLSDAVGLARRLAIAAQMRQTSHDLSENRTGKALATEARIAENLQQVINVLRNQGEQRPDQLAGKLREAEQQLAALRQQLAQLQQQVAQVEKSPAAANQQTLDKLSQQQQSARGDIEQLARKLDRQQAADAGASAKNAASRLKSNSNNGQPTPTSRPSSSREVQQAEQDLEQAAQQLAQRRQQAEDELALLFVQRFQADLTEMVKRQKQVLESTLALDSSRHAATQLSDEAAEAIAMLAAEEQDLADRAREHADLLFGLGAVRVGLEDAERRLVAAEQLLSEQHTGLPAQQAEQLALVRLEAMLDAFSQTAQEAAQNRNATPPPGAGGQSNQPQRRPTFELLEVKMLRMLQVDLNARTHAYQEKLAAESAPLDPAAKASLEREARELAAEQSRLAELVENMLSRDNEKKK
jgi:hypothetical protein